MNLKGTKLYLKGMLGHCCVKLLEKEFAQANIAVVKVENGLVILKDSSDFEKAKELAAENGMQVIEDRNLRIVEQIKIAVIELIHYAANSNSIIRNSDYLVGKIGMSYPQLSSIFSEYEGITLEKYIIRHKIEKIKELLKEDEMTLSEIAYQMGYSSVQYLSNQFKKITGMTVSEYRRVGANLPD
jgi:YesN/AraC family two-component response regulator